MVVLHFYDFAISISIHAPTRGATTVYQGRAILVRFQSTLPQEERLFPNLCVLVYVNFNPRSHKRSDLPALRPPAPFRDFNPRSHKRSDLEIAVGLMDTSISIHAPTRGATECIFRPSVAFLISIHAPTRGATQMMRINFVFARFQSTLPQEERLFR